MGKTWNRTNFKLPLFRKKKVKTCNRYKKTRLFPWQRNKRGWQSSNVGAHKYKWVRHGSQTFCRKRKKISHWKPKQTKSFWKCVYCKFVKCLRHKTIKNGHKFVPQISAQNLAVSALCGVEARGFVPLKPPLIQIHNSPTAPVLLCTNTAPHTCVYVPLNLTGGSNWLLVFSSLLFPLIRDSTASIPICQPISYPSLHH